MKLDRLNRGEAIATVSAAVLFVSMFLDWYGTELSGGPLTLPGVAFGAGGSAWATLEVISFILMLTIAVTIGAALLVLLGSEWKPAIPTTAAVTVLGGLSFILILFRMVVPPGFGALGGVSVDATLQLGIFVGLAAAAGIAYGGYRAMGLRGASFAGVADALAAKPARASAAKPKPRSEKRPEPRS